VRLWVCRHKPCRAFLASAPEVLLAIISSSLLIVAARANAERIGIAELDWSHAEARVSSSLSDFQREMRCVAGRMQGAARS